MLFISCLYSIIIIIIIITLPGQQPIQIDCNCHSTRNFLIPMLGKSSKLCRCRWSPILLKQARLDMQGWRCIWSRRCLCTIRGVWTWVGPFWSPFCGLPCRTNWIGTKGVQTAQRWGWRRLYRGRGTRPVAETRMMCPMHCCRPLSRSNYIIIWWLL